MRNKKWPKTWPLFNRRPGESFKEWVERFKTEQPDLSQKMDRIYNKWLRGLHRALRIRKKNEETKNKIKIVKGGKQEK